MYAFVDACSISFIDLGLSQKKKKRTGERLDRECEVERCVQILLSDVRSLGC